MSLTTQAALPVALLVLCAPAAPHGDAIAAAHVTEAVRYTVANSLVNVPAAALAPDETDYTYMWWADGWRGRSAEGRKVICVQTGRFGLALDADKVELLHLGRIERPASYEAAAAQSNTPVLAMPGAKLGLLVRAGGETYHCTGCVSRPGDELGYPVRIVETGRFVQRLDIADLVFKTDAGEMLPADCRIEMVAWPDRLSFVLVVTPRKALSDASASVDLHAVGVPKPMGAAEGAGGAMQAGQAYTAWSAIDFGDPQASQVGVRGRALTGDVPGAALKVDYDVARAWHRVELAPQTWKDAIGHFERAELTLENPTAAERTVRLLLAKDYSYAGITGFAPMLRDTDGYPTGLPVQLSKDWHATAGRHLVHEGPWFHGFTLLRLPPRSRARLEFDIAYGMWGGVPAASHAQLCLIGYGVNQLWDQSALGTWGESICYDPDVNLNRAMIDDVRPLMVWPMEAPGTRWSWTNNVGGGDFLVYYDDRNRKQYMSRMRTTYLTPGPNLAHTVYSGVSADGHIAMRADVFLARTDDIVRAYHRVRYDVLEPTRLARLAFYQVGADNYNAPLFGRLAWGNEDGLREEWQFDKGGNKYQRTGLALTGANPWVSLHDGTNPDVKGGGYGTRGLVIRKWRARLGGKDVRAPFAAFYGTEDGGVPGMNAELAPPPGVNELLPGDFVEADLELVIVPMTAESYYGPNEQLREALRVGANTWRPTHREASAGAITLKAIRGTVLASVPAAVRVDGAGKAVVEITGGLGYVPISFAGLKSPRAHELIETVDGVTKVVNQAVHGRDFWQADYDAVSKRWILTYNVCLDSPGDARRTVRLELRPEREAAP